jgi:hypothetical protein
MISSVRFPRLVMLYKLTHPFEFNNPLTLCLHILSSGNMYMWSRYNKKSIGPPVSFLQAAQTRNALLIHNIQKGIRSATQIICIRPEHMAFYPACRRFLFGVLHTHINYYDLDRINHSKTFATSSVQMTRSSGFPDRIAVYDSHLFGIAHGV